ncbi:MAG: peptide ABC transporter substrate-binding protein [Treponemataceae bacterium]|nr:peptide ABC transporter substrate-binding protein [Treponemataceae bacterium]
MYNFTKKMLATIFLLLAISSLFAQIAETQKELTVAISANNLNLNPHTSSYSIEAQLLTALYEGLFTYNPISLKPEKGLVSSYKISRDKKTWTFTMRDDIYFSDGTPITAQTIKESWLSLLSLGADAPYASLLDCIKGAADYRKGLGTADGVKISVNENKLTVRLTTPMTYLDRLLCHHAFSAVSENENVYSGAYVLDSVTETEIHMTKNTLFYGADHVYIPSIKVLISDGPKENTYLFNTGDVNWIADDFNGEGIYNQESIYDSVLFGTQYLFFSLHGGPLENPLVRNALLSAVPWDDIRTIFNIPADTLVFPITDYPSIPGIGDTDLELSKELLEEAGYPDGGFSVSFQITQSDLLDFLANELKKAWEPLNVQLNIQKVDSFSYYNMDYSESDIFLYSWIGDFSDPITFLELFKSDSNLNVSNWKNDNFDKLIEEANTFTDSVKRYEKLAEAEQLLLDDGILLPLCHLITQNCIDLTEIGGWFPNALDMHPFKYMYFREQVPTLSNWDL